MYFIIRPAEGSGINSGFVSVKKSLFEPALAGELDFLASKSLICRRLQSGGEFFLLLFLAERKSKTGFGEKESKF
jgi:hypothetical protein